MTVQPHQAGARQRLLPGTIAAGEGPGQAEWGRRSRWDPHALQLHPCISCRCEPLGSVSLCASAGTCATLSCPCQPPPTLPIHFPFPPCSCRSVHVASLQLWMLQEASINRHIHSRGVSGAARPGPSHQGNACPIPSSWGQSRRAWAGGGDWERWGLGQFLLSALLQT